jgi:ribonuclease D
LALDTESDSFYHYIEKVCLLQITDGQGPVALIDTLVLSDLSPLCPLMANRGIEKVLHGAENDVALLRRDFRWEFASVFDTQVAALLLGRDRTALDTLLELDLGVRHFKGPQRSDWSRRPLAPEQERYAAEDVRHLVQLRDRLLEKLAERGRDSWAREEGEAMAQTLPAPAREPANFLHAKGSADLSPRELAVLRELFSLREDWARRADLPLFKIAGDEALVALATQRPLDVRSLSRVRGLSARLKERRAPEVLAAIRRGAEAPEDQLPRRPLFRRQRMPRDASRRIGLLKSWRAGAAERAGISVGLLLPQRLIERIALDGPASLEALGAVPGIRRWRVEAFGPSILEAADLG